MSYDVGQILYVVFKGDNKVVPVQVIEEITRKTLDGLKVDYVLKAGSDKESTILFEEIDGDVFETPDVAITVLTERAKKSIVKLVNSAVEKSKLWYIGDGEHRNQVTQQLIQPKQDKVQNIEHEDAEEVKVKLPDGSYANVKFPMTA